MKRFGKQGLTLHLFIALRSRDVSILTCPFIVKIGMQTEGCQDCFHNTDIEIDIEKANRRSVCTTSGMSAALLNFALNVPVFRCNSSSTVK